VARRRDSLPLKFYASREDLFKETDPNLRAALPLMIVVPTTPDERKIYTWAKSHTTAKAQIFDKIIKGVCVQLEPDPEETGKVAPKPKKAKK